MKTQSHTNTLIQIALRQENEMSTEQQIKSAIDTLNEALELMQKLGLITEEEETEE